MRNVMRKLGYILLFGSFLCLIFSAEGHGGTQAALRAITWASKDLPQKESFARTEVTDVIHRVAFSMKQDLEPIAVPAVFMLCGGLLLDKANRNLKRPKNEA